MVLGSAITSILMVSITYHFLLRNVWQPQGLQLLADTVLHYVVPLLALLYWLVFPPRSELSALTPFAWCLYPLLYFVCMFVRGELLGSYPYYFIDVASIGYRQAMLNSFGLLVAFVALGVAVFTIATLCKRFRSPPSPVRG